MDVAPQAVLHWDRGALEAECERASTIKAGVEAYLGRAVFADEGRLVVRITLARVSEPDGVHVVARVNQEDETGRQWGERSVSGAESCASLDEPLTLVVALLVDSPGEKPAEEAATPLPEPPPPEPLAPARPPDESAEIQTAPSLERASISPAHAAFLATFVLSMGALPAAGAGGGIVASIKPKGFWGIGVEAAALLPQRKPLGAGSLEASMLTLAGNLCPLQGIDGPAWWSACASFGAARLRIESRDLLDALTRTEWIPVPGLSARAAWLLGHGFLVGGGLEAMFPVSPDRYVYRDPEGTKLPAFQVNQLLLSASLGVGLLLD